MPVRWEDVIGRRADMGNTSPGEVTLEGTCMLACEPRM